MQTPHSLIDDRPSPLMFFLPASVIGGLVWVWVVLGSVGP
jgi:hypothetical protein